MLISIMRCICLGADCLLACCFCCGSGARRSSYRDISYPQTPQVQQPGYQFTPAYHQPQPYYGNRGMNEYSSGYVEEEVPYSGQNNGSWNPVEQKSGRYAQVDNTYGNTIEMDHYGNNVEYSNAPSGGNPYRNPFEADTDYTKTRKANF